MDFQEKRSKLHVRLVPGYNRQHHFGNLSNCGLFYWRKNHIHLQILQDWISGIIHQYGLNCMFFGFANVIIILLLLLLLLLYYYVSATMSWWNKDYQYKTCTNAVLTNARCKQHDLAYASRALRSRDGKLSSRLATIQGLFDLSPLRSAFITYLLTNLPTDDKQKWNYNGRATYAPMKIHFQFPRKLYQTHFRISGLPFHLPPPPPPKNINSLDSLLLVWLVALNEIFGLYIGLRPCLEPFTSIGRFRDRVLVPVCDNIIVMDYCDNRRLYYCLQASLSGYRWNKMAWLYSTVKTAKVRHIIDVRSVRSITTF